MMRCLRSSRVLLALLFLLSSCSSKVYEMAYVSNRGGTLDIILTNSDTSFFRPLTSSKEMEYNLTWNRDGSQLYYTFYPEKGREVNVYDMTSNTIRTVIADTMLRSLNDVSGDGRFLAITTATDHPKGEIYLYDMQSTQQRRLTDNNFYEAGAKFSPDGKQLAASVQTSAGDTTNPSGNAAIFLVNVEDSSIRQLTSLDGFSGLPAFSPNGKKIAFHHCIKGVCDIYVMNNDGSGLKNLTGQQEDNRWPRWTPDGKWIIFTRTANRNSDLYFIRPDGTKMRPVVISPFRDEIAEPRPR